MCNPDLVISASPRYAVGFNCISQFQIGKRTVNYGDTLRKLYLHIGNHRTATSSIQRFLFGNFTNLMPRGIFYPFRVPRHHKQFYNIFMKKTLIKQFAAKLHTLADAKKDNIHSIILSDEDVCMRRDLSILGELRKSFDVKVIFALRRQDLWLESWYLQNIKWQWNPDLSHCSFPEFLALQKDFFWIDYNAYVEHLEIVFGRENVQLYVFEKEQMPQGPISAFCGQIGLESMAGLTPPPHANSSNSPLITEFMRCLPLDKAKPHYRSQLERACAMLQSEMNKEGAPVSTLMLDTKQRAKIMAGFAAGNKKLAKRYFNRSELFYAPLPQRNAPIASMKLPADSYKTMEQFVAPFIHNLIKITDAAEKNKQ